MRSCLVQICTLTDFECSVDGLFLTAGVALASIKLWQHFVHEAKRNCTAAPSGAHEPLELNQFVDHSQRDFGHRLDEPFALLGRRG